MKVLIGGLCAQEIAAAVIESLCGVEGFEDTESLWRGMDEVSKNALTGMIADDIERDYELNPAEAAKEAGRKWCCFCGEYVTHDENACGRGELDDAAD